MKFTTRSALAVIVGTIALAGVGVFGVAGLAGAQTADTDPLATIGSAASDQARPPRSRLTDAQKQCLADNGVTAPQRSADGTRTPPTDEQRAAFRAAAEACGLPIPTGHGPGGPGGPAEATGAIIAT